MVSAKCSVAIASLADLLSRCVTLSRKLSGFGPILASEFHEELRDIKCQLEKLQGICRKHSLLRIASVMFCIADTDPENATDNLLTEALRLFEIAEQFQADARVLRENYSQPPLVCSDVGVTRFDSGDSSENGTAPQPAILVCYVDGRESTRQLLSNLPGILSKGRNQIDIRGVVIASNSSQSSHLMTNIPTVCINYEKSWTHSCSVGLDDTNGKLFTSKPAFPYFTPTEDPVIVNVKGVTFGELSDCIAWSIDLLAQNGASIRKPCTSLSMILQHRQLRTERPTADLTQSIDHTLHGLGPHRLWWATLALFWVAFAERTMDGTELLSALTATGEDHFPVNSNLFPRGLGISSDFGEIELTAILRESLIMSEDGRIMPSSGEARIALLHLVSEPCGTDDASIHEMLAYVCLRCIERHQPASLLRPWIAIESYLDCQSTWSSLLLYAASYWQVHFRLGEHRSRRLSALLHRIVQSALSTDKMNGPSDPLSSSKMIDVGLWLSTFYDFKSLGRTYLEMGAQLEANPGTDICLLHVAASKPSLGVLALFLEGQPELNVLDLEGMTPLQAAVSRGHVAAVEMLLVAGSKVNETFLASGATALHVAVHGGHEKIVALLLEKGADTNARNVFLESPLDIALRKGNDKIAKILVGNGASYRPLSVMEQSMAETVYAFYFLSFVERDAFSTPELHQYVVQEPTRLEIHLRYF